MLLPLSKGQQINPAQLQLASLVGEHRHVLIISHVPQFQVQRLTRCQWHRQRGAQLQARLLAPVIDQAWRISLVASPALQGHPQLS